MGKVVKVSSTAQPFNNVPIKPAVQPQQPGEVLIGYELELADGCQLSTLGWCCFVALVCVAFPFSWLPFTCKRLRKKHQRPVYGYPMQNMNFQALDTASAETVKPVRDTRTPPTIVCMDSNLEHGLGPDQKPQQPPLQPTPQSPCIPSPPPTSIFIPPSAVPSCGFNADNPFPSRFSPAPMSPKSAFCVQAPITPASPAGSGLIVMGGQSLGAGVRDTRN